MRIQFCGPVDELTGYGQHARVWVQALDRAGHDVLVDPVRFGSPGRQLGAAGRRCQELRAPRQAPAPVRVLDMPPESFASHVLPDRLNLACTTWETDRLPEHWVDACNHLHGILTTSQWCARVFRASGVQAPVFAVPPGVDPDRILARQPGPPPFEAPAGTTVFYSIFEWSERKHPVGLLRAWWAAFTGRQDVLLVLKTQASDGSLAARRRVQRLVEDARRRFRLDHYPPVQVLAGPLSRDAILDLHHHGDCFVLAQRAEGFGLPHFEAMCHGTPVITTGFGGSMDFTRPELCYLVDHQLTFVGDMAWAPFVGDMRWAEPDLVHLAELMQQVAADPGAARDRGQAGQRWVFEHFPWQRCVQRFDEAVRACQQAVQTGRWQPEPWPDHPQPHERPTSQARDRGPRGRRVGPRQAARKAGARW